MRDDLSLAFVKRAHRFFLNPFTALLQIFRYDITLQLPFRRVFNSKETGQPYGSEKTRQVPVSHLEKLERGQ